MTTEKELQEYYEQQEREQQERERQASKNYWREFSEEIEDQMKKKYSLPENNEVAE